LFAQLSLWKDAGGMLKWRWKSPPELRPLYGLDALAARPHAPVFVCEGEKAAEAARPLFSGFVVIGWPGGTNAAGKSDFAPLAGRDVTLWPDVDEAGEAAMKEVAAILRRLSRLPLALYKVNPGCFGLEGGGADTADLQGWDAARCARECTDKSEWRAPVEVSASNRKPARQSESMRFRLEDDGVYAIDAEGKHERPTETARRLKVSRMWVYQVRRRRGQEGSRESLRQGGIGFPVLPIWKGRSGDGSRRKWI
jgi:hypothetical protein